MKEAKKGGKLSAVMQDRIAGTNQNEKGQECEQGPKDRDGYMPPHKSGMKKK